MICGQEGTGKSTIAKAILPHLKNGAAFDAENILQVNPFEFDARFKQLAMADLANKLYESYVPYFNSVKATTYYGDMCSKNVMITDDKFSGLVDLDALTQGDPLEAVGRMKTSWYGTAYGKAYSDAVMDELGLNDEQRKVVTAYALMSALAWTAENGIKFNENTTAVVDKQEEIEDKKRVQGLASELGY